MSTEKIGKADRVYGKETTMEELYFTIAGCSHYFGSDFMEKGMKVKLEKEPDNEYDKEAIQVKIKPSAEIYGYSLNVALLVCTNT